MILMNRKQRAMKKYILNIFVVFLAMMTFVACEDDNGFEFVNGGSPVVKYVKATKASQSDSLIVEAYLGSQIAIIGEDLAGVNKIYFNDQEAKLNPTYVTDNAIIVDIPDNIPSVKEDLIKLYTSEDSCYFSFESIVPAPTVESMTCEYVYAGDTAHLEGLYFVDYDDSPLTVTFTGDVQGEILSYDENSIDVIVPEGAEVGPITVSSVYGDGESSLYLQDNRNIILDFDTVFPDGGYNHGWHDAAGFATDNGLEGQYLIFEGELTESERDDDNYAYERWTYTPDDDDFFDVENINDYVFKFEVNVSEAWTCCALQIIFTGAEEVWMNWQNSEDWKEDDWDEDTSIWKQSGGNPNQDYMTDETYPRALWIPWKDDGTYVTDGWVTVTIPMTSFAYNADGDQVTLNGAGHYSGISLSVSGGGVSGTDCSPVIHIDNMRVVPE